MTPATILERLRETERHWAAVADDDDLNSFQRHGAISRRDLLRDVLSWLPKELDRLVIAVRAEGEPDPEPGTWGAIVAHHYAEGHTSVEPGQLITTCTEGLCPAFHRDPEPDCPNCDETAEHEPPCVLRSNVTSYEVARELAMERIA